MDVEKDGFNGVWIGELFQYQLPSTTSSIDSLKLSHQFTLHFTLVPQVEIQHYNWQDNAQDGPVAFSDLAVHIRHTAL